MTDKERLLNEIAGKFTFLKTTEEGWDRYQDESGRTGVKAMFHEKNDKVQITKNMLSAEISKEEFKQLCK